MTTPLGNVPPTKSWPLAGTLGPPMTCIAQHRRAAEVAQARHEEGERIGAAVPLVLVRVVGGDPHGDRVVVQNPSRGRRGRSIPCPPGLGLDNVTVKLFVVLQDGVGLDVDGDELRRVTGEVDLARGQGVVDEVVGIRRGVVEGRMLPVTA